MPQYLIQYGDTLYSIARRFGSTVDTLLRLNPNITNASLIYPGQQINVPLPAPVTAPGMCRIRLNAYRKG